MNTKVPVILGWQLSDLHAWGIVGQEIFSHWTMHGKFSPVMLYPINDNDIRGLDNFKKYMLMQSLQYSNEISTEIFKILSSDKNKIIDIHMPVIHALGNQLNGSGVNLNGIVNIGRAVFEYDNIADIENKISIYDALIVPSEWNKSVLQSMTNKPVYLNHEGVDTSLFHPMPKSGLYDDDIFYVFSGGKIEHRKAQDLVLKAFQKFAQSKKDVKLVTAWQSYFSKTISKGYRGCLEFGLEVDDNSHANVKKWAFDNGVDPDKVVDLGQVPHHMMPSVFKEMDVSLQISRAEGGTNMMAMESMASGIPTLISMSTGHLDILEYPNAIKIQSINNSPSTEIQGAIDWKEVDVDDVVNKLDLFYEMKKQNGSTKTSDSYPRSWKDHAHDLELVLSNYYT